MNLNKKFVEFLDMVFETPTTFALWFLGIFLVLGLIVNEIHLFLERCTPIVITF